MGGAALGFVILGRSKERSDAAQTLGSMPGLLSAPTVQILHRCTRRLMSRNGSQGLRDGASRLLRPGMTKFKCFGQPSRRHAIERQKPSQKSWLAAPFARNLFQRPYSSKRKDPIMATTKLLSDAEVEKIPAVK
ncbi:hypothetical protein EN876_33105, partial [Mesorhizobium sp. M2D.F.Ca.ET.233.01.1.1]